MERFKVLKKSYEYDGANSCKFKYKARNLNALTSDDCEAIVDTLDIIAEVRVFDLPGCVPGI